jgi:hypothetical protein
MTTATNRALLALALFIGSTSPAYAYLDPGSGSMMVQLLLGGVAGAVVIVRLYWHRVLTRLGFRRDDDRTGPKASH